MAAPGCVHRGGGNQLRRISAAALPDDLQVYRGAIESWQSGGSLYEFARPNGDAFTYPPFAGLALGWLGYLTPAQSGLAWLGLSVLALLACAVALHRRLGWPIWAVFLLLGVSAAWQSNVHFGQMSVFVFALCIVDVAAVPPRWRGILTGIAVAIKITPLVIAGLLFWKGAWRDVIRILGSAAAATGIAALLLPHDTAGYLRKGLWQVSEVANWESAGNQSLRAVVARLGIEGTGAALAMSAALLVTLCALVYRRRHELSELEVWVMGGLASILLSPISWTHHRFWLTAAILLPAVRLASSWPRAALLIAATIAPAFTIAPAWTLQGVLAPALTNLGALLTLYLLYCLSRARRGPSRLRDGL